MPKSKSKRWDLAVNVAIGATALFLVFSPSGGGLGRFLRIQYGEWRDGRRVAAMWQELSGGSSRLANAASSGGGSIVAFIDYECPACRLIAPSIRQMTERRGLTVVLRHLPNDVQHAMAKEAAAAAVCGERGGKLEAVHRSLLESDVWLADPDWPSFARRHGIADASAFVRCMHSPETAARIRADSLLAVRLGIRGTPVFVSEHGIYEGAGGFGSAVADLVDRTSDEAAIDTVPTLIPDPRALFDSRDHENAEVAQLGRLLGGFLLSKEKMVVIDGPRFHFVNFRTDAVHSLGSVGEGPGEFRMINQIVRARTHLVAWDVLLGRVTRVSNEGQVVDVTPFDVFAYFDSPMADLIAAFADGALVFEDGPPPMSAAPTGRFRPRVTYREVHTEDRARVIVAASGQEMFGSGQLVHMPVIFGHDVHAARIGDALAVSQTDWGEIRLFDRDGDVRRTIPLAPGAVPDDEDVAAARASLAERQRDRQGRTAALMRQAGLPDGLADYDGNAPQVPANEVAPRIDRMFVDAADRLWAREYQMDASDPVEWLVWDPDKGEPVHRLRLDGDTELLDARGELLLLARRDEMDVDHVLVTASVQRERP